ncbi:hypothetical protein EW026_g1764 [Hermanssonia centrifuga]|uniref:Rho GTPase-activating protein n=1 Tax=Hermanssonia centrifuga TaxID=98765 RepID=A0A4V3XB67_9APHY|nr:hypothetical protein EW026_g1764 [Hermanssonia centrifuga]
MDASANLPNFAHVKTASQLGPQATSSPPKTTSALPSSINDPAAGNRQWMVGREISSPVFDREATMNMSPIKMRNAGRPILIDQPSKKSGLSQSTQGESPWDAELGIYTHRKKASLDTGSPLLQLNKPLHKEAVKTFKSMQRVMGDRDRDRPIHNGSTTSLLAGNALLEEERSLLGEGLAHGELRDEIYCQVMKQLNGNPNPESVFKGWQLLCVLLVTFPPSKNFEASLRNFLQRATHQPEGRIDIMAKYCLRRLSHISRKGPRGKAPTLSEIESASDAAFHPSIFGESLDAIFRLQERNYPQQKVPIILPFLSDGILALGGTKSEGIFRVPGDGDTVPELKLRIDKGYYTLDGFDDPHVLASLLKLWLRELADPLIPDELYNDCITESSDPEACVMIVHRLPTINRRVVLFVVSFLQLFLEDKVQTITKMTAPNLALVMAPNLLRCSSESMAVVFTNAQYEQTFVHNLLLHLRCDEVDPDYVPVHGHGAIPSPSPPIPLSKSNPSKGRNRSNS